MKKILGLILTSIVLAASSFALEVTVGARGSVGGNIGNVDPKYDGFICGGAFYANLNLFNGFGVQAEVDLVSNTISTGKNSITFKPCEIVDIPVMLWYNNKMGSMSVGGGAGLNFSLYTDKSYMTNNKSSTNLGLALGANVKFHFAERFGVVFGINSVIDFMPTEKIESSTGEVTVVFGTADKSRKALFGSIGVEMRLF